MNLLENQMKIMITSLSKNHNYACVIIIARSVCILIEIAWGITFCSPFLYCGYHDEFDERIKP